MASEVAGMTNGTYAPHQHQPYVDQNAYAYAANNHVSQPPTAATPQQQVPPTSSTPSNAPTAAQPEIPKDEVGWYFVEQYYTTLSRSPEKLYLFYNKRSQFVSGQETDKVAVCVGQRAINDKIKELDFLDCKVRVTNVDSQASDSNIVIQVIGELSNRGQPHKKFTQTFVLATQTNGYFVLNDIFRYLVEEEDEPETETQQAAEEVQQVPGTESGYQEPVPTEVEPKTLTSSADPAAIEADAKEVDKEIEEKLVNAKQAEDAPAAAVNGEPAAEKVEETPAAQAESEVAVEAEPPSSADVDIEPEKPRDPEPSPIPTPAKEAAAPAQQAAPAPKPAAPAAPKTWASLAASANRVATPAAPAVAPPAAAPAARQAPKTATVAPAAPSATAQSATPSGPAAQRQEAQGSDSQDEWTAVGSSHNRQQSRQTNNVAQQETAQWRGYIKNVHDHVDFDKLKAELEQIGEVTYFDIARQKNCAFVDFKTKEGYEKARSTPFKIGDDEFIVEERRFKPGATPYIPRGQYQGGRGGGRGNFQAQRGGNAAPRGRGGFPRGRGAQA